ncbi:hypothetical protein AYK26_06840 [Euryarchaeota archaeon SM23-78]|nr:MAG: hypothetical protein AYK26_06840 [Euryarchaeota archaeon SM23-78]
MVSIIKKSVWFGLEKLVDMYNQAYNKYEAPTRFLSTLAGTMGGDFIAKSSQGMKYTWRDAAFTSFAAVYQSWLYPKFIDLTNHIVDKPKVEKAFKKIGISKPWAKAITIGGLFFIPNMFYWGLLSVKNRDPINLVRAKNAAKAIAIGTVPYLGVDYIVTNKVHKKYCLPIWSAAEIAYNTFLAAVAYLT